MRRDARLVCARCGVVASDAALAGEPATAEPWRWRRAHTVVAVCLAVALIVRNTFGFVTFVVDMLAVLAHEMGHAATALAVARPALPSFNLVCGGGVTSIGERSTTLLLLYAAAAGWFAYDRRDRPRVLAAVGAIAALYTLLLWSGCDAVLVVAGGIAGNAVIASVFLYGGMTGAAVVHGEAERWLYGIVGWMTFTHAIGTPWSIIHDPAAREQYLHSRCGVDNDLVVIAQDHGWQLDSVAWVMVWVCVLTMVAALGLAERRLRRRAVD